MNATSPGPWVFVESVIHSDAYKPGEADLGGFRAADGHWVCRFGDSTTYYPSEGVPPNKEDARLIAAAPELLAALQGMLDQADSPESYAAMIDRAVTAIAKATGAE